jgi:hypothetical protein
MGPGTAGAIVAATVFVVSVIFWAGYSYAKLTAFDAVKLEIRADMLQVMRRLSRIEVRLGIEEG